MDNFQKNHGPLSIKALSQRYIKWTAYGLLLIGISIFQSLPFGIPAVFGVRPTLMIPAVVCIAMFEGAMGGAAAGVAGGLLWDLFADRLFGFSAFWLLFICCFCGLLSQLLIRNNLISSMLMVVSALCIYGILDWFFNTILAGGSEPLLELLFYTLPNVLYSLLITPLIYWMVSRVARFLRSRE